MSPPPPTSLLGPPELHNATPATRKTYASAVVTGNPFMDLMTANFNTTVIPRPPPLGYTENMSATYLATGNPCLDFFFHVVPNTPSETINRRLHLAWSHNALTTLKLVCNLRGVRGTGKSDKEGFYAAAYWLHGNHPKTLACNVGSVADFGYFKDLPEILYRLLEGPDVRKNQKSEWESKKRKGGSGKKRNAIRVASFGRHGHGGRSNPKMKRAPRNRATREVRILNEKERARVEKEDASALRHGKYIAMAKKFFERYSRDPDYRFLYERVSDLFADILKADIQSFNSGALNKISLAAKWCPSIDSSFDRSTLICESIARKVFPRELYPEYEGVEEAHYAYRVRDRLRKEILVPLRKALELPEVYIGANQWGSIPYGRVASVAMKNYKEKFTKHDGKRFAAYLEKVKEGKAKIAAGALLPHEIIVSLNDSDPLRKEILVPLRKALELPEVYIGANQWGSKAKIAAGALLPHEIIASLNDSDGGEVAELQWKRMVDDLSKKRKLKNCLAICDVSGSMSGEPMEVSVALGVLVSELSEEPWKGKLITFSAKPQLQNVDGHDLRSKTNFVRRMEWGMNTDFQKVFDLILRVAVKGKLSQDQMIKRVIVFSHMEFDQASTNSWETDYQVITRKFNEKGYGSCVPEVVFWNLRDSNATPVPSNQKGVALVSGFSKNLLTFFLEENGSLHPEAVMEAAISGEEYKKLAVLD